MNLRSIAPVTPEQRFAVAAAMMRLDLYSFLQGCYPIISPGSPMLPNWHLEAMCYQLERLQRGEIRRLIITVPPRSLKSITASVAFPAFVLGQNPARRIISVSYSDSLAKFHASSARTLMRSGLYGQVFPGSRISPAKDTETEIRTTTGGFRLATSVGGTLTGRGAGLIIIDDPMKPQDAQSETMRDNVRHWFTNTVLSRLDDKKCDGIVVVMQRLHPDDLVGQLLQYGDWFHLNLPAIADEREFVELGPERCYLRFKGGLLHPDREGRVQLDEMRNSMGAMDFAAQYQQAPVPLGGNLIKWEWFKFMDVLPSPQYYDEIIVSWDTAMSSSQLSDFSACVVLLIRAGRMYVMDVMRARLDYPDLKRAVQLMHQRWYSTVKQYSLLIERKGSGMSLIQDLQREGIYAIGDDPSGDKVMRMAAQTAPIESGAVHLPKDAPWLSEFKLEMMSFPKGRHDDQVDALSQALHRARNPPATVPVAQFGYSRRAT